MELKDAFEDYHLYLSVVQRKSKKTVQSYLHDIEVYLDFLKDRKISKCENISVLDIEAFLDHHSKCDIIKECSFMYFWYMIGFCTVFNHDNTIFIHIVFIEPSI